MKLIHAWMAGAVLAMVVVSGCGGAVSKPGDEPVADLEPLTKPSLIGTWEWFGEFDDGNLYLLTLTFAGDRYIEIWRRIEGEGATNSVRHSNEQGGWSATDSELTKTYYYHDFSGPEAVIDTGSVNKQYSFDGPDVLLIECWTCDGGPILRTDRMIRISADPLPDLEGVWAGYGYQGDRRYTLTVEGATVTYVETRLVEGDSFTTRGTGTIDPETYFIDLVNVTDENGIPLRGGTARIAVAPGLGGTFHVSPFWYESPLMELRHEAGVAVAFPYGFYHQEYKRLVKHTGDHDGPRR